MIRLLDLLDDDSRSRLISSPEPQWVNPMLATLADEPFSDSGWVFERKLDGERCLAFGDGAEIRLRSRNRRDLNNTYPELLEPLAAIESDRFIVDGEVVAFDGGITSFSQLQQRMQIRDPEKAATSGVPVYYYLFDVLHIGGYDTSDVPLRHRKRLLKKLLTYRDPLRFTPHRNENGASLFSDACDKGWEGLIAKDAASPYTHTRSRKWLKLKCVNRQELVIGGFTDPQGKRTRFGAILVGYHRGDELVYAGRVGTGFDENTLNRLGDAMARRRCRTSPFDRGDISVRDVHWVTPDLVAEIGFAEWTSGGKLRHPRFLGLRQDKPASDVVREKAP